jgi:hypothetical protein
MEPYDQGVTNLQITQYNETYRVSQYRNTEAQLQLDRLAPQVPVKAEVGKLILDQTEWKKIVDTRRVGMEPPGTYKLNPRAGQEYHTRDRSLRAPVSDKEESIAQMIGLEDRSANLQGHLIEALNLEMVAEVTGIYRAINPVTRTYDAGLAASYYQNPGTQVVSLTDGDKWDNSGSPMACFSYAWNLHINAPRKPQVAIMGIAAAQAMVSSADFRSRIGLTENILDLQPPENGEWKVLTGRVRGMTILIHSTNFTGIDGLPHTMMDDDVWMGPWSEVAGTEVDGFCYRPIWSTAPASSAPGSRVYRHPDLGTRSFYVEVGIGEQTAYQPIIGGAPFGVLFRGVLKNPGVIADFPTFTI